MAGRGFTTEQPGKPLKKKYLSINLMYCMCLVAQSYLTLCNPLDCSPPGSSVHGDSPGKNTGVGCHSLLQWIFPTQEPGRPALQADFLLCEPPGRPYRCPNIYEESYNTLVKEIKELNKWRDPPCLWIERFNIIKMSILSNSINRFSTKVLENYFVDIYKGI